MLLSRHTRRREVIKLLAGAAIWPGTVSAQQPGKLHFVGFLWDSPTVTPEDLVAFRAGLRDLGWIEGQSAGRDLGLRIEPVAVTEAAQFSKAFSGMRSVGAEAVVILATPLFNSSSKRLADLALEHKLPTLFARREQAERGGLISYGPDRGDLNRRAATYVDKILKGARPKTFRCNSQRNSSW